MSFLVLPFSENTLPAQLRSSTDEMQTAKVTAETVSQSAAQQNSTLTQKSAQLDLTESQTSQITSLEASMHTKSKWS